MNFKSSIVPTCLHCIHRYVHPLLAVEPKGPEKKKAEPLRQWPLISDGIPFPSLLLRKLRLFEYGANAVISTSMGPPVPNHNLDKLPDASLYHFAKIQNVSGNEHVSPAVRFLFERATKIARFILSFK
jgi:hypothetical protein